MTAGRELETHDDSRNVRKSWSRRACNLFLVREHVAKSAESPGGIRNCRVHVEIDTQARSASE